MKDNKGRRRLIDPTVIAMIWQAPAVRGGTCQIALPTKHFSAEAMLNHAKSAPDASAVGCACVQTRLGRHLGRPALHNRKRVDCERMLLGFLRVSNNPNADLIVARVSGSQSVVRARHLPRPEPSPRARRTRRTCSASPTPSTATSTACLRTWRFVSEQPSALRMSARCLQVHIVMLV